MNVTELNGYRQRRSVRRAAAYLVAAFGVLGAIASLLNSGRTLDTCIRKAAQLLPDVEDDAA